MAAHSFHRSAERGVNREKGSVLLLAIIASLILSVIVIGVLTVSSTEMDATQNYYMKKISYYHALDRLEDVIEQVRNSDDPTAISIAAATSPTVEGDNTTRTYYTGDMVNGTKPITYFDSFQAPPLPGMSMGTETSYVPVMYRVPLVSQIEKKGSREANAKAFTELDAGVYALMRQY